MPLEAQVKELDLVGRVHLVGHHADVLPWLAALDAFVLPSDWEGMSNALLEAMAAGLPVVATAVGGTREVVVDGVTGLLVPPGDPDSLAEAISRLLGDSDMRHTMGEAGRARVDRHFSIEQTVRRTEELYMALLEERGY
jgi:glycosyltransferase involved in cell wall biosynthesis